MTGFSARKSTALVGVLLVTVIGGGCNNKGGSSPSAATATPPVLKSKSGIEMIVIPAGSFEMGSRAGNEDETPIHKVSLDSFLMDRSEVTQAEFEKLGAMADPPFSNSSHFKGPDLPAEQVTWVLAVRFCNARSLAEGLKPCYNEVADCDFAADGYRLPTEAEWEYACRAGTSGDYSFGNESRQLGDHAWYVDNTDKKTHPVKMKKPNAWGLYDMHGNVAEWCQDGYDKNYYKTSPVANPRGPQSDKEYVLRGGSWKSKEKDLRSAARLSESPGFSDACLARDAIGFRCVRKVPPEEVSVAK